MPSFIAIFRRCDIIWDMDCFIIAMQNEADPVIRAMESAEESVMCGKKLFKGKLFGSEVCVIVCGVGKVNAACGAQLAISALNAQRLVNIGVAGGLHDGLEVGGIYSVSRAVQYDFDLTQLNGTPIGTLDECTENYIALSCGCKFPKMSLATGDRFNDSPADYKLLTRTLKADIRDMEGGAVAQVCMHAKIPFFSYKIISDLAGKGSTTEQYLENLKICFKNLAAELKNIVNDLNGIEK